MSEICSGVNEATSAANAAGFTPVRAVGNIGGTLALDVGGADVGNANGKEAKGGVS